MQVLKEVLIAKYGEMALKGLNKSTFEEIMQKNVRRSLAKIGKFQYTRSQSTLYVVPESSDIDVDEATDILGKVFGIAAISRCAVCEKNFIAIVETVEKYLREKLEDAKTFKVEAKRADKKFPLTSPQICTELGGEILEKFPNLSVDVHSPDVTVTVEIREEYAYIHSGNIAGAGGLPVGTGGKALLMLSGGIDSPVAGYLMAKRGVALSAVHFASPPYTSALALKKVKDLCRELTPYCGHMTFYCVPFTKLSEVIKQCKEEYYTIIMRRIMVEIAQRIALKNGLQALVTGESLGQVASQTMGALACTDAVAKIPILRPLIGADKAEIVQISRKIGTFDTSILPYADCCTVFTPKRPKTRPTVEETEKIQNAVDFSALIDEATEQLIIDN